MSFLDDHVGERPFMHLRNEYSFEVCEYRLGAEDPAWNVQWGVSGDIQAEICRRQLAVLMCNWFQSLLRGLGPFLISPCRMNDHSSGKCNSQTEVVITSKGSLQTHTSWTLGVTGRVWWNPKWKHHVSVCLSGAWWQPVYCKNTKVFPFFCSDIGDMSFINYLTWVSSSLQCQSRDITHCLIHHLLESLTMF